MYCILMGLSLQCEGWQDFQCTKFHSDGSAMFYRAPCKIKCGATSIFLLPTKRIRAMRMCASMGNVSSSSKGKNWGKWEICPTTSFVAILGVLSYSLSVLLPETMRRCFKGSGQKWKSQSNFLALFCPRRLFFSQWVYFMSLSFLVL